MNIKEIPQRGKSQNKKPFVDPVSLFVFFGVVAIIVQLYFGWSGFLRAWNYVVGVTNEEILARGGIKTSYEYERFAEIRRTAPLYLKLPIELGFQFAVLVFVKHYSNRLKRLETQQSS